MAIIRWSSKMTIKGTYDDHVVIVWRPWLWTWTRDRKRGTQLSNQLQLWRDPVEQIRWGSEIKITWIFWQTVASANNFAIVKSDHLLVQKLKKSTLLLRFGPIRSEKQKKWVEWLKTMLSMLQGWLFFGFGRFVHFLASKCPQPNLIAPNTKTFQKI